MTNQQHNMPPADQANDDRITSSMPSPDSIGNHNTTTKTTDNITGTSGEDQTASSAPTSTLEPADSTRSAAADQPVGSISEIAPPPYDHTQGVLPLEKKEKKPVLIEAPLHGNFEPNEEQEAAAANLPWWRRRRLLLLAALVLLVLIVVPVTTTAVILTQRNSRNASQSISTSTSISTGPDPTTNSASTPTNTSFRPSNPSSSASALAGGKASAPIVNTAISVMAVLQAYTKVDTANSMVSIFFQDKDSWLCEKMSVVGVESWDLTDSGNRLLKVMNGTPIAAVTTPWTTQTGSHVFYISPDGFLADIVQTTIGGPWTNGTLIGQHFIPQRMWAESVFSMSAVWCISGPTVYVQATDGKIHAFQLKYSDKEGANLWSELYGNFGGDPEWSARANFAAVCTGAADENMPSPVYVNKFDYSADSNTGALEVFVNNDTSEWFPITNRSLTLPPSISSLYRPNSPIALILNVTSLFMLFPLPTNISTTLPNPSIHLISTTAYNPISSDWTENTMHIDTGIVPYATGSEDMSDASLQATGGGVSLTVGTHVDTTMPRSWSAIRMEGNQVGRVIIAYLSEDGSSIQIGDVIGQRGKPGIYNVIS